MKFTAFRPAFGLALLAPGLALAQGGSYTVQGQLGSKMAPTKAFLVTPNGDKVVTDSTEVKNGRFTFKGTVAAPTAATLFVLKPGTQRNNMRFTTNRRMHRLYLEPGTIRIASPDSMDHATLSGTPLNVDQSRMLAATRPTSLRMTALMQEYEAASPEKRKEKAFDADIDRRYEAIQADEKVALKQFVLSAPKSQVSLAALNTYGGSSPDPAEVSPLFEGLAPAVRESKEGQEYAGRIEKARKTAVGAVAPEFTQNDVNGKPVKLSDYRGKYVLVDFWASWCGPCRQENPNVVAAYNQYKNRSFTVLGVSLDKSTGRDKWLKAIETDGLTWTQVSDLNFWKNEVAQLYGIQSIPQNFLVGPDGRIVAKNLRGDALTQKLAVVLPTSAQ